MMSTFERSPDLLRNNVDQFVIHYSVEGTSRQTFGKLAEGHLSVQLSLASETLERDNQ